MDTDPTRSLLEALHRQAADLRASELRFLSVVQSVAEAIIVADEQARIISLNKAAEHIFGYEEEEVLGYPLELLMPERYRNAHRIGLERFRLTGKSRVIGKVLEARGLRKDGTDFPLELSLASWTAREGTFFTGIIRDITERKRGEELRLAKETAENASRAKSNFIASMSHELRTPLNAIIGFTNVLLQDKNRNLSPQQIDFLERILINAKDQLQLINGVLDLAKIEAGRMELHISPVSLESLIREIVKQIEGRRRGREVEIVLKLSDSMAPVSTDPAKLKRVLINLIDNALKFTERGMVTIAVATGPMDRIPTRIDVIDTGPGIPGDRLHEIFEPFQQLETSPRRFGGTGLGLSISRSLCDLLGYGLEVRSQPGRGTTFTIRLNAEANRMPLSA